MPSFTRRALSRLIIKRFARLGAYLQDPRDLVQECLVLDGLTALEGLDVVGLGVDLLGEFGLSHLVGFLAAALGDGFADLRVHLLHGDDVVGAVDFGETLAFDAGFGGLLFFEKDSYVRKMCRRDKGGKGGRWRKGFGHTGLPVENFFSVPTMVPLL